MPPNARTATDPLPISLLRCQPPTATRLASESTRPRTQALFYHSFVSSFLGKAVVAFANSSCWRECWPRAIAISFQSIQNTLFHWTDQRRLGSELKDVVVPPPLFVLGHWRNGTTLLHNLLTVDQRFAFPNNYQSLFPNSFLTAGSLHSRASDFFLPKRRPMDASLWTSAKQLDVDVWGLDFLQGSPNCNTTDLVLRDRLEPIDY